MARNRLILVANARLSPEVQFQFEENMSELLTLERAKLLLELCRAGNLYEIKSWIASGKSIRMPPEIKRTPLRVAIELGFHSLIELLSSRSEPPKSGRGNGGQKGTPD